MTRSENWWSASTQHWTGGTGRRSKPWCHLGWSSRSASEPVGWAEWRANLEEFFRGFPDGHHVIEEFLVDGSHGITRCRFTGTHTGEFRGIAPTGAKVSVAGIHIDRFQGDTLVAHRGQLDMHGLMEQLKGT